MLARLISLIVNFGARVCRQQLPGSAEDEADSSKQRALRTGVRGETYACGYARRDGYVLVARNCSSPGLKGEIDMVGYDGSVHAFVEVKTRTKIAQTEKCAELQTTPESAVNLEKRRNISREAQQFLRARHIVSAECRSTSWPSKPSRAKGHSCGCTEVHSSGRTPGLPSVV